jgi:transcriptional regulator with XRE-family HTH domain
MKIENSGQLCKVLRQIRKTAGVSQEDLAKSIGMNRSAFSKMEANRNKISLDKFIKWAEICNCKLILEEIYE